MKIQRAAKYRKVDFSPVPHFSAPEEGVLQGFRMGFDNGQQITIQLICSFLQANILAGLGRKMGKQTIVGDTEVNVPNRFLRTDSV